MKSADRTTSNGDKAKRKNLPRKDGTGSIDKSRKRRHHHMWPNKQDSRRQRKNCPRLDERAQIIARREQKPNGKNSSRKTVRNDCKRQRYAAKRKRLCPRWRFCHPLSGDHREKNERDAEQGCLQHAP